jgi:uncharacterized protein with FMN-binding domain
MLFTSDDAGCGRVAAGGCKREGKHKRNSMSTKNRKRPGGVARVAKKLGLSAFLILTFGAYAAEHGATGGAAKPADVAALAPSGAAAGDASGQPPVATTGPSPDNAAAAPAAPTTGPAQPAPTATPASAPTATAQPQVASNGLKDGTYTGPSVDVQWGLVQVQATIQGGKITNVQFLQFPSDRRTSQRINAQADPWLQQEAIQAQSANVDLISGATLTSEGFAQSLQGALDAARS